MGRSDTIPILFASPDQRAASRKNMRMLSRGQDFPFDHTNPDQGYGQPGVAGGMSRGSGPSHSPITPKDTEHSIWDDDAQGNQEKSAWDELAEAIGTPINFGISGNSNRGSSVPGLGGFSVDPPKEDDEEVEEEMGFMDPLSPTPGVPEMPLNPGCDYRKDQSDEEIILKLNRLWGREDNSNFAPPDSLFRNGEFVPFAKIDGLSVSPEPSTSGILPQNSAWDEILQLISKEIFLRK